MRVMRLVAELLVVGLYVSGIRALVLLCELEQVELA
jgi:hypothetical protein